MLTIKLRGGLGNQLFQYAFGRNAANRLGIDLALDPHGYDDPRYANSNTPRKYLLDKFNIKASVISIEESQKQNSFWIKVGRKIKSKIKPENPWKFDPSQLSIAGDSAYMVGYWQSEKYFKDSEKVIRDDLILKSPLGNIAQDMQQIIESSPLSVSLHIRRTDYLSDHLLSESGCTLEYYDKAIQYIAERSSIDRLNIFVFSDDIEWVKSNLKTDHNVIFVSHKEIADYEELVLMSKCRHHIIANSTFSWWGAWLDQKSDKIVMAPQKWSGSQIDAPDIVPAEWVRI